MINADKNSKEGPLERHDLGSICEHQISVK